ncbi:MAG: ester cyclase [Candidatus Rokubacteria bacterium]|nr:ester cyclase [Candidatus Rokubacteria bacterium]
MATDIKTIVRRCFEDIVCKGDLAAADELISEELVFTTASGAVLKGRREFQRFAQQFRNAFPDISFDIQDEIQEGDRVCTRYVMRGTFASTLMGLLPTGQEFAVRGMDTFRVKDGKVVEIFANYDTLGQMQQLGAIPKL